jgi:diguanylate cyclase (GGDEF)-like protein/PAS domain S-box-containing protein
LIESDIDKESLKQMSGRLLQLGEKVERSDQAKAAADFSARLLAQTRAHENAKLMLENAAAKERAQFLEDSRQQAIWLAIASASTMLVLAIGSWLTLRSRAAARRSEARLRSVTDHLPARVTQMDADLRFVFVNPEVTKALQKSEAELVGQKISDVLPGESFDAIKPHLETALRGSNVSFELSSPTLDYSRVDLVPDRERSGKVSGVFALQFDISELKRAEQALQQLARTDALTGMNNRRSFDERIVEVLARHRRNHSGVCLLSFDIDKFKSVNDTLGHAAGDQVIIAFARRLQACLRDVDFAARLGGDEFMVLLENCQTPASAETVARKIQHLLLEPIELAADAPDQARSLVVTTSIGIGFAPPMVDPTVASLSELSDQALYAAKAAGRNTFRVAAVASP